MKKGIIYKATSPSGKIYIGQTVQKLNIRISAHISIAYNKNSSKYNYILYRAIRKYGKNNFKWEIIYKNIPYNKLSDLEIKTIKKYNSYKNGYNQTLGGEGTIGFKHSNKTKKKLSKYRKGRPAHPNVSKANKSRGGEKHYCAKLNWKKVSKIRQLHKDGYSNAYLANKYSVSKGAISKVVTNRSWKLK